MYAWLTSICAIDQYAYMYISVWVQQIHVPIEKDTCTTDTVLLVLLSLRRIEKAVKPK